MQIIAPWKCRQRHSCLKPAFWKGNSVIPDRSVAWHVVLVSSLNTEAVASLGVLGEWQGGKTYRTSLKSATCGFYYHTKIRELCWVL